MLSSLINLFLFATIAEPGLNNPVPLTCNAGELDKLPISDLRPLRLACFSSKIIISVICNSVGSLKSKGDDTAHYRK